MNNYFGDIEMEQEFGDEKHWPKYLGDSKNVIKYVCDIAKVAKRKMVLLGQVTDEIMIVLVILQFPHIFPKSASRYVPPPFPPLIFVTGVRLDTPPPPPPQEKHRQQPHHKNNNTRTTCYFTTSVP